MKISSLVGHVVELLDLVRGTREPADRVIADFFAARRYLGSKDRRFVAERCYLILRNLRLVDWYASRALMRGDTGAAVPSPPALALWVAASARLSGDDPAAVLADLSELWRTNLPDVDCAQFLSRLAKAPAPAEVEQEIPKRLALQYSFPDFVVEEWVGRFGAADTEELCRASNNPAPVTLRVNTLKCSVEECRSALAREGCTVRRTALSPFGLIIDKRINLQLFPPFRDGWCEPQDEGSQLLSCGLDVAPGMMVVDACAGGGGKTLHIAALTQNAAGIVAIDTDGKKLRALGIRAARAGAKIQRMLVAGPDDRAIADLQGKADAVLVDAPCSGTGTIRRNPWAKTGLTREFVHDLALKQREMLDRYSRLVKPCGRLVYATCSLLREEDEDVAAGFLAAHEEFAPVPASEAWGRFVPTEAGSPYLVLRPDRHGTDGYFAAAFRRNGPVAS